MYYAIIVFEDIITEGFMLSIAGHLYFKLTGNVVTMVLVSVSGAFSICACLGEMLITCC